MSTAIPPVFLGLGAGKDGLDAITPPPDGRRLHDARAGQRHDAALLNTKAQVRRVFGRLKSVTAPPSPHPDTYAGRALVTTAPASPSRRASA
jgi:hypothetical protein